MRLPHLPLHCWNQKTLQIIGNVLGKYIDQAVRKDQYSCARICVEVDLEEGLPEAIKLSVARWTHVQELDYKQLPFKCRYCHEHGHFAKNCKKKIEEQAAKTSEDQWTVVQKTTRQKKGNGKGSLPEAPSGSKPNQDKEATQKGVENTQANPSTSTQENPEHVADRSPIKEGEEIPQVETAQRSPSSPSIC